MNFLGVRAVGKMVELGTGKLEKNKEHGSAKKIQKFLSGFAEDDPEQKWMKLIVKVGFEIFSRYNLQFIYLLDGSTLEFSWTKGWFPTFKKLYDETQFSLCAN